MGAPSGEGSKLYHVIYSSAATERLSQDKLLELLKISRRNNEARGLTGMLVYRNGTYLQFLEGDRNEVLGLLNRLREDRRHKSISILREGTLPERLFPDWSMAYKNLAGLRSEHVSGYSERLQADFEPQNPEDPAQLLIELFEKTLSNAS